MVNPVLALETDAPKRAFESVVSSLTPLLHWRLGTNGLTDQSGNARNGTGQGNLVVGGVASPLVATTDAATHFDAAQNQSATSTYSPFDNAGVQTFLGFVKRDSVAATHAIFGGTTTTGPALRLTQNTDDMVFLANLTAASVTWSNVGVGTGAWHLVGLRFSPAANTVELFVDGVSKGEQTMTTDYATLGQAGNLRLSGSSAVTTNPWAGDIDEFFVVGSAVSATDQLRMARYRKDLGIGDTAMSVHEALSPELYWPLNAEYGAIDRSGNERDGSTPSAASSRHFIGADPSLPDGSSSVSVFDRFATATVRDTFTSGALGAADAGGTWNTDQFVPVNEDARIRQASNFATNVISGAGDSRSYAQMNLGTPVQALGATFKWSSGAGPSGQMALLGMDFIDADNSLTFFGNVHLNATNSMWQYQVVSSGVLNVLDSGTHSLVMDDTTLYEIAVLIRDDKAWIKLPDGNYRLIEDSRIRDRVANWATFEITYDNSATSRVKYQKVWMDTQPVGTFPGSCTRLNGTDQAILSNYNPFQQASTRTFTAWVNRESTSGNHTIFGNSVGLNLGNFWLRMLDGSQTAQFVINWTGTGAATASWNNALPSTGTWHHVALIVNDGANTAELYVDGVSLGSQSFASTNTSYNALPGVFRAGIWRDSGLEWFKGKLAHVAVFARALSVGEIEILVETP